MIARNTKACFLTVLFLGTTLSGLGQSYAGFQTKDTSASDLPVPTGISTSVPANVSNVQMDGSPLPPVATTSSLQIFNDRYVPDSVRKKYNLNDDWFGKETPTNLTPTSLTPNDLDTGMTGAPAMPVMPPLDSPSPVAQAVAKEPVESWRARKGENIRDVLQRWSSRNGANLMWASPDTPMLQKDFTYVGKFQDAVNELIKTEGGDKIHSQYRSEGLNPVMMEPASTVTTNTPPAMKDAVPVPVVEEATNPLAKIFQPEEKKPDAKPETRWFALSGAPLAEVMKVWAEDANVHLIWQSERNFAVKESVSQVGHFEDAVYRVLNQYNGEEVRPVGELYKDPQSGETTLLVRTEVN